MERHLNAAPWNMIHEMGLFWRMDVWRMENGEWMYGSCTMANTSVRKYIFFAVTPVIGACTMTIIHPHTVTALQWCSPY